MKKTLLILTILLYIFSVNISTAFSENLTDTEDELGLTATSAILMDAKTGEILYEKNKDNQEYPASITKLITVLLAFENGNLNDTITFSNEAVFGIERNSSHIAIDVGEQLTLEQSLYAILLRSANEVSLGVAEYIDGSIENFAQHMNSRAKELGCKNTNFITPNGLHDENHYTTAYDMALIAKEVLKFDKFREIIATRKYDIPPTNKNSETRYLYGQHQMINKNSIYYYEGCEGGKNGYTDQALNTLVSYAKNDNMELIAVVFKEHGADHYIDTAKLFDYGFENFKTVQAFSSSAFSSEISAFGENNGNKLEAGKINLKAENDIFATIPKNSTLNISQKIFCENELTIPITEGSVLGNLEVYNNNILIGTTNLLASNTIDKIPQNIIDENEKAIKEEKIKNLKLIILKIVIILIILIIILICILEFNHRQKVKRIRARRRRRSGRTQDNI